MVFSGILITIGAVIDETQDHANIIRMRPCAKAREILVLKWVVAGFILTLSYKAVLLSNLMHIEYEKPFDTVDDILSSPKPVMIDGTSAGISLLKTDPRRKVKEIAKKVTPFKAEKGWPPPWVPQG